MKKTKKVRVSNAMQFQNAVMKIASESGEDCACANVRIAKYAKSRPLEITYQCYTPQGGWQEGKTMSEALDNLRNAIEVKEAAVVPGPENQNESFDDFPI